MTLVFHCTLRSGQSSRKAAQYFTASPSPHSSRESRSCGSTRVAPAGQRWAVLYRATDTIPQPIPTPAPQHANKQCPLRNRRCFALSPPCGRAPHKERSRCQTARGPSLASNNTTATHTRTSAKRRPRLAGFPRHPTALWTFLRSECRHRNQLHGRRGYKP
jgi:hypothetical protein